MILNNIRFVCSLCMVFSPTWLLAQAPVTQTVQKPVTTEVIATSTIQGIPAGAVIQGLPAGAVIRNGQIIIDQTTTTTSVPTTTVSNGVVVEAAAAAVPAGTSSLEADIIAQTNMHRARSGLPPLSADPGLMNSARAHASWMASNNRFQHTAAIVIENIAMGQTRAPEVLNDWMGSPGHRANILRAGITSIGVGAYTGSNGQTYWCQQFR
jgi:uncharacterized protein YkwD